MAKPATSLASSPTNAAPADPNGTIKTFAFQWTHSSYTMPSVFFRLSMSPVERLSTALLRVGCCPLGMESADADGGADCVVECCLD